MSAESHEATVVFELTAAVAAFVCPPATLKDRCHRLHRLHVDGDSSTTAASRAAAAGVEPTWSDFFRTLLEQCVDSAREQSIRIYHIEAIF